MGGSGSKIWIDLNRVCDVNVELKTEEGRILTIPRISVEFVDCKVACVKRGIERADMFPNAAEGTSQVLNERRIRGSVSF